MASRLPFDMPSGCPEIVVETDILGSLPFCTLPSFANPTFMPKLPVPVAPDIAPPDACLCLSVIATGRERIIASNGMHLSAHMSKRGSDCCEGVYNLSLFLDMPCMPLSLAGTGTVSLLADIDDPEIAVALRKSSAPSRCGLSLALDIDLPCVPFEFADPTGIRGIVSMLPTPGAPATLSLHLEFARDACVLGFSGHYHLRLPPFDADGVSLCIEGDADVDTPLYKSIQVYEA